MSDFASRISLPGNGGDILITANLGTQAATTAGPIDATAPGRVTLTVGGPDASGTVTMSAEEAIVVRNSLNTAHLIAWERDRSKDRVVGSDGRDAPAHRPPWEEFGFAGPREWAAAGGPDPNTGRHNDI